MKSAAPIMRFAYATGSRPLDGYTIKRGVGVGGFGEVYFAVSDAGKEVAVKRIQRNLDVEIRGVSQCLNLKHPHLVAIYDIRYDEEGQAWVVMEYVRGESLKDVIERNPNGMPLAEAMDWFRGISAGVAYLHDHGIVHRDLKPGNVFLDESVVKIGDYGLSKYISCSRRSGQTESVGTFHYMAPEIGRGVYGKEIDVYALGIILYEMLTGRVPYDGESSHEIILKHLTAAPDVTPLPESLRPIVQRALFKDPEQRFRSIGDMLSAVITAVGGSASNAGFVARHAAAASPSGGAANSKIPFPSADMPADGMYFGPVKQVAQAAAQAGISPSVFDEPVANAVRHGVRTVLEVWKGLKVTPPVRFVLMVAMLLVFLTNLGWILPAATILGSIYLVYFGIRAIVMALAESPAPTVPSASPFPVQPARPGPVVIPVAASMPEPPAQAIKARAIPIKRRRRWQEVAGEQLRRKTLGERLMELTGSMLMSSFVIIVVSFLLLIVTGNPVDGSVASWTRFMWMALTSVLGTWAILLPAKLWEGEAEDTVRRRFFQVVSGLAVGAAAFGLEHFLDPNLAKSPIIDTPVAWSPSPDLFARDGSPQFPAYLVYFAGLFLLLRWWSQADPLRPARFSLWTCVATTAIALVWQIFWPFPQPWSLMMPATMSIALQLSAPWVNTDQRSEYRKLVEV